MGADDSTRTIHREQPLNTTFLFESFSIFQFCDLPEWRPFPSLRKTIDDLSMFVVGEVEADEPLAVEQPRRLLQQRNPPLVVLDQVIVG